MKPAQTTTPLIETITNRLPFVEKILLTALGIGAVLSISDVDGIVIRVAFLGLGVTFFLYTYRQVDIQRTENEEFGFSDLLGLMVVPKVLWISSAVSAIGIAFYMFEFGNNGYEKMLLVGALATVVGTLLLLILSATGVRHVNVVLPILFRAVPLLLLDLYILFLNY